MILTIKGKKIALSKLQFLTEGGQAKVYVHGNTAYKIYHDKGSMIPVAKIQELCSLNLDTVLAPQEIIYNDNREAIGFTMKYISSKEYLCRLFTKAFRKANNVSEDMIINIIDQMRKTIDIIHQHGILLVDINELNFLVSKAFDIVYFIDVDSWQTKSYPAGALMESVRDRLVKNNQFSVGSDWFSFGVLACQLLTGCHPYKGIHPNYKRTEWMRMMDDNVSIFHKETTMPPATNPISCIPANYKRWFDAIFVNKERIPPPNVAGNYSVPLVQPTIIQGTGSFDFVELFNYPSEVVSLRYHEGFYYVVCKEGIYRDQAKIFTPININKYVLYDIVFCTDGTPVILEFNRLTSKYNCYSVRGDLICSGEEEGYFISDSLYIINGGHLIRFEFLNTKTKILATAEGVGSISFSRKAFDGLVVEEPLGKKMLSIPFGGRMFSSLRIKELDGFKILDAKYRKNKAVLIGDKKGKRTIFCLTFSKNHLEYSLIEKTTDEYVVNFSVKDNGVAILFRDAVLEAYQEVTQTKEFPSPLNGDEKIHCIGNDTCIINANKIIKLTSKK